MWFSTGRKWSTLHKLGNKKKKTKREKQKEKKSSMGKKTFTSCRGFGEILNNRVIKFVFNIVSGLLSYSDSFPFFFSRFFFVKFLGFFL